VPAIANEAIDLALADPLRARPGPERPQICYAGSNGNPEVNISRPAPKYFTPQHTVTGFLPDAMLRFSPFSHGNQP
jgi:hypothetical protein